MKNEKGFSLIELLIVVVIIGIIAAVAIPNLLASRRSANEGAAVSGLRTIHSAQLTYASSYGGGEYAGSVPATNGLPTLAAVDILDESIGSGVKSGYNYVTYGMPRTPTAPATFVAGASAITRSGVTQTGTRDFLIATEGMIFYDDMANTNGMAWNSAAGRITITGGLVVGN